MRKTGTYSFPETHNGGNNQRRVAAKTLTAVKFSLMLKKVKTALRLGICVYWSCYAILWFSNSVKNEDATPMFSLFPFGWIILPISPINQGCPQGPLFMDLRSRSIYS